MTTTMTDLASGKTCLFNEALPGRDAYEEALSQGFTGTRAEWVASLRGLEFDPENAAWENDRAYPPRAAVIHANSFWFADAANQGAEPGVEAVWVKLVHGEDAAALTQALTQMGTLRDEAALIASAAEDQDLGGGTYSANHHRLKAETARDEAALIAGAAEDQDLGDGTYSANHHRLKAETARDEAALIAGAAEDQDLGGGTYSANHHRLKAEGARDEAALSVAAVPTVVSSSATLAAVLGQVAREQPALRQSMEDAIAILNAATEGFEASFDTIISAAFFALRVASQTSGQVNGGRVAMTGGTLDDPALRIGTAGIYSSAADTLSIAIAGSEVARFTPSGLTIFGTITEAP
ncbi:hypothetical protein [Roseinatronobacter sp.]|uniref:hypothetical protein n=1 Tax=Roseinatronobacter sp. TaxID=1945755 RepID=UPI0025EFC368|nr:hypothetical protein [Roseibaca sp.]